MKIRILRNLLFCLTLILLASSLAAGQGTTSRVTGTVQDANGGAVAGALVTLTSEGTSIAFTTATSDSGAYAFDLVQVGKYGHYWKQGFKSLSASNFDQRQPATTINATLETGGVKRLRCGAGEQVRPVPPAILVAPLNEDAQSLPIVARAVEPLAC